MIANIPEEYFTGCNPLEYLKSLQYVELEPPVLDTASIEKIERKEVEMDLD